MLEFDVANSHASTTIDSGDDTETVIMGTADGLGDSRSEVLISSPEA